MAELAPGSKVGVVQPHGTSRIGVRSGELRAGILVHEGPKGDKGEKGDQGDQGVEGPTGPANKLTIGTVTTGGAGTQASATIGGTAPNQTLSLTIPRGDKGDKGDQGIQGLKGDKGDKGDRGDDGTSVTIQGSVPTAAELPTTLTAADAGKGYITQNDGHLHVWDGDSFNDVGEVKGPRGDTGPQGPQGEVGPIGPRGSKWFSGEGPPGAIPEAQPNDQYLDTLTGDVYQLQ